MAVMNNRSECIYASIRQIQGIFFVFLVVLFGTTVVYSSPRECDSIKKDFQTYGVSSPVILDRPSTGLVCGEDSCCAPEFEKVLLQKSQISINSFLNDSISKIATLIETRSKKFDEFFREMMNKSRIEFHQMFERTYGKIYLQNADVFGDFFNELETYYRRGSLRLSDTMDTFFGILYQKMFAVLNSQYTFDEKYLQCVVEHMVDMKPFGDVPHKLGVQLRRSFVATRTFYKALSIGADVAEKMSQMKIDEQCVKDLAKMQHCGGCSGQRGEGACSGYCIATLESCLRYHVAFSTDWDNFIDAIEKVADRLLGPFNIEVVVQPLNIKISEAVMNFQESGTEVSKKIYTLCGKPTLRLKRDADVDSPDGDNKNYELTYTSGGNGKSKSRKKHKKTEKHNNVPTLEKLIKDIKTKVRDTRQFWAQLPYQYCNNEQIAAGPSAEGNCWNGTALGSYTKPKQTSLAHESAIVKEQIYTLQQLTDKLRRAHQGEEVELVDDSEETLAGSGSGSGQGELEEDDEEIGGDPDVILGNHDENVISPDDDRKEYPKTTSTSTFIPEFEKNDITSGSRSSTVETISLSRALAQYLIPIVLVWFGGAISDLL